jgi:hypothetical protein
LGGSFEGWLILLGMDAVGGANLDAKRIFDAVISNHIGHDEGLLKEVRALGSVRNECKKVEDAGP